MTSNDGLDGGSGGAVPGNVVVDLELFRSRESRSDSGHSAFTRFDRVRLAVAQGARLVGDRRTWSKAVKVARRRNGVRILASYAWSLAADVFAVTPSRFSGIAVPPVLRLHDGPLVSVIMPVFNQEDELLAAVDSVRKQTLTSWELIIWDDGSTHPRTLEILADLESGHSEGGLSAPANRTFRHENSGVVAARNSAARIAKGEYLVFLDPDDTIHPTYLEKAFLALQGLPACHVASPDTLLLGHPELDLWTAAELEWPRIRYYNQLPVASMIEKSAFDYVGGFSHEMDLGWEDWDLWVRVAAKGFRSKVLGEPLFRYSYSDETGRDATQGRPNENLLRSKILRTKADRLGTSVSPNLANPKLTDVIAALPRRNLPHTTPSVVFFIPWLIEGGGADEFLRNLACGFSEHGITCIFVSTSPYLPPGAPDDQPRFLQDFPYFYRLPLFLHPGNYKPFIRSLLADLDRPIAMNMGSQVFYDLLESQPDATALCSRVVDILFNGEGQTRSHHITRHSFTDVVVAYDGLRDELAQRQIVTAPMHVIPVGIAVAESTPRVRGALPVVGWLGRFAEEKRPMWFVSLARELRGLAEFRMAGEGPQLAECRRFGKQIPGLTIEGFVESVQRFLSEIDVLVITSRVEGIPLAAMEAISMGVPVIAPSVGGLPDVVLPGVNGRLAVGSSLASITDELREVLKDPIAFERLIESTREHGLPQHYHLVHMVKSYLGLILSDEGLRDHGA